MRTMKKITKTALLALAVMVGGLTGPVFSGADPQPSAQGKMPTLIFEGTKLKLSAPLPKAQWDKALEWADRSGQQIIINHSAYGPDPRYVEVACWGSPCVRGILTLESLTRNDRRHVRYEGIKRLELVYSDGCGGPCARVPYP